MPEIVKKILNDKLRILGAAASLGLIMLVWIWAPQIVGWAADRFAANAPACQSDPNGEICKWAHSRLGVTGDLFGSVSSLFSGLGLFAVAVTLWLDASARQKAKKPLVVCKLDGDSLVLHRPAVENPKSLSLTIKAIAKNSGEVALNCQIKYSITIDNQLDRLEAVALDEPLATNGVIETEITRLIHGPSLDRFLAAIRLEQKIVLTTNVECDSLEGVRWSTTVQHEISCTHDIGRSRLLSLERSSADFATQWGGGAAVSLTVSTKPGSWIYKSI